MIDNIKEILLNGNLKYRLKILKDLEKIDTEGKFPKYPVLILTCMDLRIDIHRIFQLDPGDVFILRNAGNLFTSDTLRSILLAVYQYNINYIIILGHLGCGMTKLNMLELRKKVPYEFFPPRKREELDLFSEIKGFFKPFLDELRNIKQQIAHVRRLKVHKKDLIITGMLYDSETGWVFEYETFQELNNLESFRKVFNSILDIKKSQFLEFIESHETEIIKFEDSSEEQTKFTPLEQINNGEAIITDNFKENTNFNNIPQPDQTNFTQTILPKIVVPQIHFPKIRIYVPKISKNIR